MLEAACSGRLTADWRDENGNGANTSPGELEEADEESPSTWRKQPLEDFVQSSFYGPRFSAESYSVDGIPTVRTTDIGFDGCISLKNPPRVNVSAEELQRYGLRNGDLLITRTGATIGKCAVYDESIGPAIPGAYLIRFRLRESLLLSKFALLFLTSPQGQLFLIGGTTAVAQPNVNAKAICKFIVPVPPIPEQRQIVCRVGELFALADRLESRYVKAKHYLDSLKQSILAKAFRGELVPQDPNDEPATVLLERIRNARPTQSANRSRRKANHSAPSPTQKCVD